MTAAYQQDSHVADPQNSTMDVVYTGTYEEAGGSILLTRRTS
jgi:hypothetical protein